MMANTTIRRSFFRMDEVTYSTSAALIPRFIRTRTQMRRRKRIRTRMRPRSRT